MTTDTRERILAALRDLLTGPGAGSVTLDAVAAAAGVSKGGLLYHFPSKGALYLGLLTAIRDRVATDMAASAATSGPVRAYLDYSLPTDDAEGSFFSSLIAAVRTDPETESEASGLLAEIFRAWEAPMRAAISDPVHAELISLVGNGVYLSAIAGLPLPDPALLAAVFDRLLADTGPAPTVS